MHILTRAGRPLDTPGVTRHRALQCWTACRKLWQPHVGHLKEGTRLCVRERPSVITRTRLLMSQYTDKAVG